MMTNWIEENIIPDRIVYRHKVKMLTNQLNQELQKPINDFFEMVNKENASEDVYEARELTEQIHIATLAMEHFFRLGMQLNDMDPVRKQGLTTQMNILLKSYGLETMDVPIA